MTIAADGITAPADADIVPNDGVDGDDDRGDYVTVQVAPSATVGGDVWDDVNQNGLQDDGDLSEVGVAGIQVCLTGDNSSGNAVDVPCTTTDASGHYSFAVPPSDDAGYTITFGSLPDDSTAFTKADQGADEPKDSDAGSGGTATRQVVVISGAVDNDTDAGLVGAVSAAKSTSDEGATVRPGDTLTYYLTFENTSSLASVPVDYTDNLSGVLDNVIGAPTPAVDPAKSTGSLTVGAVTDGAFAVTGTLAAGEKVVVDYTVTFKADGDDGDLSAFNYMYPTGSNPTQPSPEDCASTHLCTTNPLAMEAAELQVDKDEPAGPFLPGQQVRFQVTVQNVGEAPATDVVVSELGGVNLTNVTFDAGATPPVGSFSADGKTWSIPELLGGDVYQASVTADVAAVLSGDATAAVNAVDVSGTDSSTGDSLKPSGTQPNDGVGDDDDQYDASTIDLAAPAHLGGSVWDDRDGDGVQDEGEAPVKGVTVCLNGLDALGDAVLDSLTGKACTLTGEDGTYSFSVPLSDENGYTVTFTAPKGTGFTRVDVAGAVTPDADTDSDAQPGDVAGQATSTTPIVVTDDTPNTLTDAGLVAAVVASKAVASADDPVRYGSIVIYTLTFDNSDGPVGAPVAYSDALADVLDDAAFNNNILVTNGSADTTMTATLNEAGTGIDVAGFVAAGDTTTITYSVTANDGGELGDHSLDNQLFTGPTPGDCTATTCTVTPVEPSAPILKVDKSQPEAPSDAGFAPGSTVTYQLTATNSGPADADAVVVTEFGGQNLTNLVIVPADPDDTVSVDADGHPVWQVGTLSAGDVATATVTADIVEMATDAAINTVQISGVDSVTGEPIAPDAPPADAQGSDIVPNDTIDADADMGDVVSVPVAPQASDDDTPADDNPPADGNPPADDETPADGNPPADDNPPADGNNSPADDETPADGNPPADDNPPADGNNSPADDGQDDDSAVGLATDPAEDDAAGSSASQNGADPADETAAVGTGGQVVAGGLTGLIGVAGSLLLAGLVLGVVIAMRRRRA